MQQTAKRIAAAIMIAAISAATAADDASPWRINESADEITDEITYFVYCLGSPVRMSEYTSYRPSICVKVTPKKSTATGGLLYSGGVLFSIETDHLQRGTCEITTRFDREKATTETWSTTADRDGAFAPSWKATVQKLTSSTNLTVRYTTTLGHVRTSTFDVRGLTNALHQVKVKYQARR